LITIRRRAKKKQQKAGEVKQHGGEMGELTVIQMIVAQRRRQELRERQEKELRARKRGGPLSHILVLLLIAAFLIVAQYVLFHLLRHFFNIPLHP
jgi:hypothetical protein